MHDGGGKGSKQATPRLSCNDVEEIDLPFRKGDYSPPLCDSNKLIQDPFTMWEGVGGNRAVVGGGDCFILCGRKFPIHY